MIGNSTNKEGVSVIIPLLNEESFVERCITILQERIQEKTTEVIFVDGGSTDQSVLLLASSPFKLIKSSAGRAVQMNRGAKEARNTILYFLHIDSIPPLGFDRIINNEIEKGATAGCFQMRFDHQHWALQIAGYFTQFNLPICRGGDQSLFIQKQLFQQMEGFKEHYPICEDNEFTDRLYREGTFKVLPPILISSARRFEQNGVLYTQLIHGVVHLLRVLGASPTRLQRFYKRYIQ